MKNITIPKRFGYPTVDITINGKEETFQSGVEISVDDAIAEAIENAIALEPKANALNSPWKRFVDGSEEFRLEASDLEGIEEICDNAFYYCLNLVGIEIPSTVKRIGSKALYGCQKLLNLKIPASVTNIDASALHIATADDKATIEVMGTTPPTIVTNTFYSPRIEKIIVPKGCGDAYKSDANWSGFADYIVEKE